MLVRQGCRQEAGQEEGEALSESPHLTPAEVAEITEPLTQGAARCRFFRGLGCKVQEKPNGQPLVARVEYEAALLSKGPRKPQARRTSEVVRPDWQALRALRRA